MRSMIERKVTQGCASLVRVFAVVCAVLLAGAAAYPQGSTGRILGVVTDRSGGNVAGANVTITDAARGVSQTLATDSDGAYVAVNVLPGTYTLRAEFKGFKVFERKNILVEVGKDVRIDAVLQPGSTTETITITEEVPMVDTTSTTLGGTISNEIINDLPLNGRNYQNLLTLRPGTMIYPGGGPWTQSTNGIRPDDIGYIIDGLPNDEAFMGLSITNAAAVLGDAATILPVDAIQEFNTQVNPKAEFGWKPGAVTSVGLKSGTNEIHGSAYAYGRSDSFDARNFFNHVNPDGSVQAKTPVELEQFGGTAGGRIIKDKLFYFGGFEEQEYTVSSALLVTAPTTAPLPANGGNGCSNMATGDCKNSIADAMTDLGCTFANPGPCSPASLGLLKYFGNNNTTSTSISPAYPNTNLSRNVLGKIDYHLNDRHSVNGSYFFGNDALVGEDTPYTNIAFLTHVHSRAQMAAGHWAWTPNSQWANEARFGYTRYTLSIAPGDANKPASSYGLFTGVTNPIIGGLPDITVGGGFTTVGNFFSFPKFVGPDRTYDFIDQMAHSVGRHAIKFGGQIRDIKVDQATWRRARGDIKFANLESFLLGTPGSAKFLATSNSALGSPERHMTQWGYAAFVQDDWRIVPRVTLNLGLRYEYATPPSEAHNLLGGFDQTSGMVQVGKQISSLYNGDHKNFSPRVGVAWDVTGKGTTIVRAGYSLVYDLLTMDTFLSQQNTQNAPTIGVGVIPTGATIVTCPAGPTACGTTGVPLVTPGTGTIVTTGLNLLASSLTWPGTANAPVFPANSASSLQCGDGATPPATAANPNPVKDPGPCSFLAMDHNYKTPYVSNWTLGIQHAFSDKLSLEVAYVGNHGSRLTGIRDLNQPDPNNGFAQAFAKFPYLGIINLMSNIFRSNYNGLQTTLTTRNYHGLGFILGYTYSHSLDNMSYNWNQFLPQDSLHPTADYGNSDFDVKHRFTLSLTYAIPGKKTWGQLLEGWQINSILTLQSGQPWSMFDQTNGFSGTGEGTDRWDFFGNPADFKSRGTGGIPCFGPGNPFCTGATIPQACTAAATSIGLNALASLNTVGYCYMAGKSLMIPNAINAFGTMGRNIFRDTGFHNLDLSVTKAWKFKERLTAQFRVEGFNVLNHANFANPWGGISGYGPAGLFSDPSAPGLFGWGGNTPDVASANPVLGSGSARAIQLGLKLTF